MGEMVTMPPASTTSPIAYASSRVPAFPMTLTVVGGKAFEVDGWFAAPGFFLGAIVNDDNGDEDDVLMTLSGSHK